MSDEKPEMSDGAQKVFVYPFEKSKARKHVANWQNRFEVIVDC